MIDKHSDPIRPDDISRWNVFLDPDRGAEDHAREGSRTYKQNPETPRVF
jgi:hypothetical protein